MKDLVRSRLPNGFRVLHGSIFHVHTIKVDGEGIVGRGDLVGRKVAVLGFHSGDVRQPVGYVFNVLSTGGLDGMQKHRIPRPDDVRMDAVWAEDLALELVESAHRGHDVVPLEQLF